MEVVYVFNSNIVIHPQASVGTKFQEVIHTQILQLIHTFLPHHAIPRTRRVAAH